MTIETMENEIKITTCFRLFLLIILFNITILYTGAVLHEWGHYLAGTVFSNCGGEIILFDTTFFGPYTKLNCPTTPNTLFLDLSSFMLIIPFALCFLLLNGFPEKNYFFIILGVAIMSASLDIQHLTGLEIAHITSLFIGVGVYLSGQYLLTDSVFKRFRENI